jgi:rubrerythrin
MNTKQLEELLLQSLEHERGGVKIYRMALQCALNPDLREEWTHYLEQTEHHVKVLTETCAKLGIDPGLRTPGCQIVRENGVALVRAMQMALAAGDPQAAEIVACEAVVLAETKDHADWELIGAAAKAAQGETAEALASAYEQVEDEEDEHLYHTKGWCRELWLASLGLDAQLPPPEETEHVTSAIAAARVKEARMEKQ